MAKKNKMPPQKLRDQGIAGAERQFTLDWLKSPEYRTRIGRNIPSLDTEQKLDDYVSQSIKAVEDIPIISKSPTQYRREQRKAGLIGKDYRLPQNVYNIEELFYGADPRAGGTYFGQEAPGVDPFIKINPDVVTEESLPLAATHELRHAADLAPEHMGVQSDIIFEPEGGRKAYRRGDYNYLTNPSEQRAFIMELRRAANLKPGQPVSEQEVMELRKKHPQAENLFENFDDKTISDMLNTFAMLDFENISPDNMMIDQRLV